MRKQDLKEHDQKLKACNDSLQVCVANYHNGYVRMHKLRGLWKSIAWGREWIQIYIHTPENGLYPM